MTCASASPISHTPTFRSREYQLEIEPLLTIDQERALAAAAARGETEARNRLVRANLRLVVTFARRFASHGMDQDDLIGEGTLGLIKATERFDPAFGVRFATFARQWIEQAIRSALTDRSRAVRLPSHMVAMLRKWRRAELELIVEIGGRPTFEEVAGRLGLAPARRELVWRALLAASAEGQSVDESGAPLGEIPGTAEGPGEAIERTEELADLAARMARRLNKRERRVLEMRFGLGGGVPMTLKAVGTSLGLTREWVRKLELGAVAKLRRGKGRE